MANPKPDTARLQARLDALTRSYESLEREVEHYQHLAHCVQRTQRALAQCRRTEEILGALLKQVSEFVPLSRSAILEWGRDGLTARTVAVHGFRSSPALIGRHIQLKEAPDLDHIRREGSPVLRRQTRDPLRWMPTPQLSEHRRDWLGIPLTSRGLGIGCMVLESPPGRGFNPTHIQVAESMSGHAATAIDNATLRARFHDMAAERAQLAHAHRTFIGGLAQQLTHHLEPIEAQLPTLNEPTQVALEAALHLTGQVEQLSRIRGKVHRASVHQVPIQDIFDRLQHTLQPAVQPHSTSLAFDVQLTNPNITSNGQSLYSCLYELVSNAARVTPGGEVNVTAEHRRKGGWAIRVQDSGPGLGQEDQRACLDAFWQGTYRNPQGSGMGLYIASMHALSLGGQLQVWSQAGYGAIFSLLLPESVPK